MTTMAEQRYAQQFRDIVSAIAKKVVEEERPDIRIGKIYSFNPVESTAMVLFAGETVESLVKVRVGKNMEPRTMMEKEFAEKSYEATGDIVRVAGKAGSLFIIDYYAGKPKVIAPGEVGEEELADEVVEVIEEAKEVSTDAKSKAEQALLDAEAAFNEASAATIAAGTAKEDAEQALADAATAFEKAAAVDTVVTGWTFSGTTKIDGGDIETDTIKTLQLDALAITSKHTITGALFQTTSQASRGIKINSGALIAYNSSGQATFYIDASTGSVSMLGALTSGSSITGASIFGTVITGGIYQTTDQASRGVKINSSGLLSYSNTGQLTFSIDANTGAVSMLGELRSGSSINGAMITTNGPDSSSNIRINSVGTAGFGHAIEIFANSHPTQPARIRPRPLDSGRSGMLLTSGNQSGNNTSQSLIELWGTSSTYGIDMFGQINSTGGTATFSSVSLGAGLNTFKAPGINDTPIDTGTTPNVWISSSNQLVGRIGSTRDLKLNIEDLSIEDAKHILDLQPRTFYDRNSCETRAAYMAGEVEEDTSTSVRRRVGLIAEEVHETGFQELVQYADNAEITSVNYDRVGLILIPLIRELYQELDAVKTQLAAQ